MTKSEAIFFGATFLLIIFGGFFSIYYFIEKIAWEENNRITRDVYCGDFLNERGIDPYPNRWDDTLWYEKEDGDYCNDIPVTMNCFIDKHGSACSVKEREARRS